MLARCCSLASSTVGTLVKAFIAHESKGYRVKSKGAKIKYKDKTRKGYVQVLNCYVLLDTKKPEIKEMMTGPFRFKLFHPGVMILIYHY
jgi:hypothetical protein